MTKRDLFRILIKIFGLYSAILTIFNFIPTNIGYAISSFEPIVLIWLFGASALTILILFLLIFKADKIIDFLKLDKGFDNETIEFKNFKESSIVKLALIVIGGLLIIENIPDFLTYAYYAFKSQVSYKGLDSDYPFIGNVGVDYFRWSFSAINILLGYIMLTNQNRISKWLIKSERKKTLANKGNRGTSH